MPTEKIWLPKWTSSVWPFTMITFPLQIVILFRASLYQTTASSLLFLFSYYILTKQLCKRLPLVAVHSTFPCSRAVTMVHIIITKPGNYSVPVNLFSGPSGLTSRCCLTFRSWRVLLLIRISHGLVIFLYITLSNGIWSPKDLVITELYKPCCLPYKEDS